MGIQFSVTGKQMDVGDALRQHIETNVSGLVQKYFGHGIEGHAVISKEAHRFCVDLSVHIGRGILIQAHEKGSDPYQAADKAADNIAKRMRRYKQRLRNHHANDKEHQAEQVSYQILASEPDWDEPQTAEPEALHPVVVAEMTTEVATLTVSEAVMRLDLASLPALMFRNSAHGELNVVYRRTDGNIGWVDPSAGQPRH